MIIMIIRMCGFVFCFEVDLTFLNIVEERWLHLSLALCMTSYNTCLHFKAFWELKRLNHHHQNLKPTERRFSSHIVEAFWGVLSTACWKNVQLKVLMKLEFLQIEENEVEKDFEYWREPLLQCNFWYKKVVEQKMGRNLTTIWLWIHAPNAWEIEDQLDVFEQNPNTRSMEFESEKWRKGFENIEQGSNPLHALWSKQKMIWFEDRKLLEWHQSITTILGTNLERKFEFYHSNGSNGRIRNDQRVWRRKHKTMHPYNHNNHMKMA